MLKTVTWCTTTPLNCGTCTPVGSSVYLCITSSKIAQKACVDSLNGQTDFDWQTIPGTITAVSNCGHVCGKTTNYTYTFSYEDLYLVPGEEVLTADILGVECVTCLTKLIQDLAGNDVYVKTVNGVSILVNQHGCEYPFTAVVVEPPVPPPTTPYLAADFIAPDVGNCSMATLTTNVGLAEGMEVSILTTDGPFGDYIIGTILSPTSMTLCNTGSGGVSGTIVPYLSVGGNYQAPIVEVPPAVVTAVYEDDFETGGTKAAWWTSDSILAANYAPNTAAATYDGVIKHAGLKSIQYYVTVASGDGQRPFMLSKEGFTGSLQTEICLEFWHLAQSLYPWPSGAQAIAGIGYDTTPSSDNFQTKFSVIGGNASLALRSFQNSSLYDVTQPVAAPMLENSWHKWGLYMKMNAYGVADGIVSLYKDGVLVTSLNNIELRAPGQPGVNYFWIGNDYQNGGSAPAGPGSMWFDDIKVYDTLPY